MKLNDDGTMDIAVDGVIERRKCVTIEPIIPGRPVSWIPQINDNEKIITTLDGGVFIVSTNRTR